MIHQSRRGSEINSMWVHLVLALLALSSGVQAELCRSPTEPTRQFCEHPPVDPITLTAYQGRWYEAYATANARHSIADPTCVTALYELLPNASVSVLNCYHQRDMFRPECVAGVATPVDTVSRLDVRFGGRGGPYIVAAVVGDAAYGYAAAAVYSCRWINGAALEKWGVLVRNPWQARVVIPQLLWRVQCKGYQVRGVVWETTRQGAGCRYWYGPQGYDVRAV